MKDDDKKLLEAVIQRHAPWIQKAIKHLRGMGKIGTQFEDGDFYNTGYNALAEALASYDKEKGSFKTHAQGIIKHRILRHIEKEMARSGGGGLDPYFLSHARQAKKAKAKAEAEKVSLPLSEGSNETPTEAETPAVKQTPVSTEEPPAIPSPEKKPSQVD